MKQFQLTKIPDDQDDLDFDEEYLWSPSVAGSTDVKNRAPSGGDLPL